jgi:fatty acid desaturase
VIPVTVFFAIPLLYAAWQRRKRRREALADPRGGLSAETKRALKHKDRATGALFVFALVSAGLAIWEYPPRYWVPPAILAVVAFVISSYFEFTIAWNTGGK